MSRSRKGGARAGLVAGILIGIVLGAGGYGVARLAAVPDPEPPVHYHANWAVVVDGARLDLTADRYMEDVGSCSADPSNMAPEERVHMHEANHDIVHVHAPGVTWGHLLSNIGFGVGDDYLETDHSLLADDADRTLKFIANGTEVRSIRNRPIRDGDRMLISYGPESVEEVIRDQFSTVAEDAHEYNTMPDPASCAGNLADETATERIRRALWF